MNQTADISVPAEWLERILVLADNGMILVGGQALAFWTAYYDTPAPVIAITRDVDFLGTKADVERLARGLGARAVFPPKGGLTLLVGQIVKDLPGGSYINIDVLSRVYGDVTTKAIADRAVPAESPAGSFLVMHPLDVLQSRVENVYGLSEKGDEHGIAQLRVAIDVARSFVADIASQESGGVVEHGRPVALRHLARIERLALSDAGRKVAKKHGLHVADAIDPVLVSHVSQFVSKKLPQLLKLMSPQRRAELLSRRS